MKWRLFGFLECIMLLLFGVIGCQVYKIELRTWCNSGKAENYLYLEKLITEDVTNRYCMEQGMDPLYNKSPDKVLYDFINSYRLGDSTYIIAKCYDKNFKLVAEGGDMIYIQENLEAGIQEMYIYPNLYFTSEQMQKIYDFNHKYGNTEVSRVEGYYKGKDFIVTALRVEKNGDESDGEYVEIRNGEKQKTVIYDRTQVTMYAMFLKTRAKVRPVTYPFTGLGSLGEYITEKFEQGRADTIKQYNQEQYEISVLKTAMSYNTECLEGARGIAGIHEFLYNGETYFLEYSTITDISYIMLVEAGLLVYLAMLFLLLQVITIVLWIVFLKVIKKQKRLEHAKVVLTNGVAHELKSPLAVIKNYGECIRDEVNIQKNEHYLEGILNESDRMNAMVVQMLQYIRYTNVGYALNKELFSLEELAIETIKEKERRIKQKELEVTVECKGNTEVICDGELIKLVIDNYLTNAIQYTKEKGNIRINIMESKHTFTSKVECYIWNEGKTLSRQEQEDIWEVYFRGDKARTRTNNSTGFGLAICKHILKLHKGKYGCFDDENGMVFYFELKRGMKK